MASYVTFWQNKMVPGGVTSHFLGSVPASTHDIVGEWVSG